MSRSQSKRKSKRPPKRKRRSVSRDPAIESRQTAVQQALQLQQAGQWQAAVEAYTQLLAEYPRDGGVWQLLGLTLHAAGQHQDAANCLFQAVEFLPGQPEVVANLGAVLRANGDLEGAREKMEPAAAQFPDSAPLQMNLGTVLMELGHCELAEPFVLRAHQLDPDSSVAAMNVGNLWIQQGRLRDAEKWLNGLLPQYPDDAAIQLNLAEVLRQLGRFETAIERSQQVISRHPDHIEATLTLGRCHLGLQRYREAQEVFERLIEQHSRLAKAHHYLGQTWFAQRELAKAASYLERAVELAPGDPFARSRLGLMYLELDQPQRAIEQLQQSLQLNPRDNATHSCLLFALSSDSEINPADLYQAHLDWSARHGQPKHDANIESIHRRRDLRPDRKLKIGYVSPDLRQHAVASFFAPVLSAHHRDRVEVFCYAELKRPDEMSAALRNLSDHWRETTGLSDRQVANLIAEDGIDILVDLAGHTAGNRLTAFAYRPAPIQATWLGYPNTTGMDCIDYRFGCPIQDPVDHPSYHTETLVRMEHGSFCFNFPDPAPSIQPLPATENGFITLGALHRPQKITPRTHDLWAAVLKSIPNSKLLIFNTRFTKETMGWHRAALVDRGVAEDRISIENETPYDFLQMYDRIDIALDVTPWAGTTTTLGALWMGVPVIALRGDRRSARSTAVVVAGIGHHDWIADSPEDYIQRVVTLANDLPQLSALRHSIRPKLQATILDAERFTNELESHYLKFWRCWLEGHKNSLSIRSRGQ